jgi:hypothetical protein
MVEHLPLREFYDLQISQVVTQLEERTHLGIYSECLVTQLVLKGEPDQMVS